VKYGVFIGVTKEAVVEVRKAILEILGSRNDQKTIRVALQTLKDGVKVENAHISNVSIDGGKK
jgi:hypothetical protein